MKISLASARVNAGLTQIKAAEAVGVAPVTLAGWEMGKRNIPANKLISLCGLYEIDVNNIRLDTRRGQNDG